MATTAGIDTWSIGWYLREDSSADRALRSLASKKAGRADLVPDPIAGHRVLYDRGHRFLYAEGHPDPDGLCAADPDRLIAAKQRLESDLRDLGVDAPSQPGRFDRAGSPGFA